MAFIDHFLQTTDRCGEDVTTFMKTIGHGVHIVTTECRTCARRRDGDNDELRGWDLHGTIGVRKANFLASPPISKTDSRVDETIRHNGDGEGEAAGGSANSSV